MIRPTLFLRTPGIAADKNTRSQCLIGVSVTGHTSYRGRGSFAVLWSVCRVQRHCDHGTDCPAGAVPARMWWPHGTHDRACLPCGL